MAKRLQGEFTTIEGTDVLIEVHDTEYVGSVGNYICERPGYTLKYNPVESNDKYSPILASTCDIHMLVNGETHILDFFTDLIDSAERRFIVVIYRDGFLYWVGYVMTDKIVKDDDYEPWALNLTCTDYIKTLKELPYETDNVYGKTTKQDLLYQVIEKIGLTSFHTFNALLKVITRYYPSNITYDLNKNPLEHTRVRNGRLIQLDSDGENTEKTTWYDVLEQLCFNNNARFYYASGNYRFEEINELGEATIVVHSYNSANTKISSAATGNVSVNFYNTIVKEEGSKEEYLPPLRKVKGTYEFFTGANVILEQGNLTKTIPDVIASTDSVFTYRVRTFIDATQWRSTFFLPNDLIWVHCRLQLSLGGYSFRRVQTFNTNTGYPDPPGPEGWVFGAATYDFFVPVFANTNQLVLQLPIAPFDHNIPASGDLFMDIYTFVVHFYDSGAWQAQAANFIEPITISISDEYFEFLYSGFPTDNIDSRTYNAVNTNTNNSKLYEREYWFGDGPTANTLGSIEASDDLITWEATTAWRHRSATQRTLIQWLIDEIIAGQSIVLPIKVYAFYGYTSPVLTITRNSKIYMFSRGSFNGYEESCSGEWIFLNYAPGDIERPAPVDHGVDAPVSFNRGSFTGLVNSDSTTPLQFTNHPLFTDGSIISSVAGLLIPKTGATLIPMLALEANEKFSTGDIVQLINPINGVNQLLTVSADAIEGDTNLQILPTDLIDTYPSGSYLRRTGANIGGVSVGGGVYTGGSCYLRVQTFINQSSTSITATIPLPVAGLELLLEVYRGGLKGINGVDFLVDGQTITPTDGDYENENIKIIVHGRARWERQAFLNHSGTYVEVTNFKLLTSNNDWLTEKFLNQSTSAIVITVGTLPTTDVPGNLVVYRGSRMAIYNTDFTISGSTITFTEALENEDVYVQFREENLGDLLRVFRGGRFGIYTEDYTLDIANNRIIPSTESGDYENENIEIFQLIC